ncbi:MAG: hypothetical protein BWX61_00738 [Bacteroidetes bacterium ADurb.Bin035]|nr:MAG: hypothetical protein BWX61_00738 [Bacteroidetes bacterium ADurb.Bin035]
MYSSMLSIPCSVDRSAIIIFTFISYFSLRSFANCSNLFCRLDTNVISCFIAANSVAKASPIPLDAPVISAIPLDLLISISFISILLVCKINIKTKL